MSVSKVNKRRKKGQRPSKDELHAARRAIRPEDGLCPLCGRDMVDGPSLNEHHLVPRSYGGVERYVIHRVCHDKIHSVFSEAELAHVYNTFEALRAHPDIRVFVKWVRKQDPETIAKSRKTRSRRA